MTQLLPVSPDYVESASDMARHQSARGYGLRVRFNVLLNAIYTPPAGGTRYAAMEGLRGIAILMVFVCHYDVLIRQRFALSSSVEFVSSTVGRMGTAGVDLFFLLSGLLIYRSAIRTDFKYGRFLKRRAIRIYPPFLAIFALYLALSLALPRVTQELGAGWQLVKAIAQNLVFLPGFIDVKPIVSVAWSLSYEWYFYMVAPLLVILLHVREWTHSRRITLLLIAGSIYIGLSALGPQLSELFGFPIYRFHVRLVMFIAGMIVFELLELRWPSTRSQMWEWGAIGLATVSLSAFFLIEMVHGPIRMASVYTPRFEAIRCVVLVAIFAPITLFSLGRRDLLNSLLITPELRWLGNISYSYYLVHAFAIDVVRVAIVRLPVMHSLPLVVCTLLFPVTFVVTLVAAVSLFVLVERRLSLRPSSGEGKVKSGEVVESAFVEGKTVSLHTGHLSSMANGQSVSDVV
jgi:exopolysaccharide production protein ExoZ